MSVPSVRNYAAKYFPVFVTYAECCTKLKLHIANILLYIQLLTPNNEWRTIYSKRILNNIHSTTCSLFLLIYLIWKLIYMHNETSFYINNNK